MSAFELGRVVATRGVLARYTISEIRALLARHASGDWGELDPHDRKENERALRVGTRIFSSYETPKGKAWVITEADRFSTCVLLPQEY